MEFKPWTVLFYLLVAVGLFFGFRSFANRVPEPAPASANWSDGYGSGIVLSISVENIAYDCNLGKKFLEIMKRSELTVPPPVEGPNSIPAYINIPIHLPDGRLFIDKYYLRYWDDTLFFEPVYCEEIK